MLSAPWSATDTVTDVGGVRGVDHANDLQLDPRRQQFEESAAATEQHRDLVNLQLVEHTRLEGLLRRIPTMNQHVAVTCGSLRLCHRADDPIGHVCHQWVFRDRRSWR